VKKPVVLCFTLITLLALAACQPEGVLPARTPTVAQSPSASPSLPASATLATTRTPTPPPQLEQPTATFTAGPPTETYTPSPTPGPFEYTIQQGDTLLFIIQQAPFNYRDTGVISEIIALNPSIPRPDVLPPPGSVILIPRQTATPTPEGYEQTRVLLPPPSPASQVAVIQHNVVEGETIIGIAASNGTNIAVLATLNPSIDFIGCDFSKPAAPGCTVPLVVGQQVNVPAPTPSPTLSPTFSGSETPTATPTYAPPQPVFPPEGANANARTFQLQWLSAGILQPDETYVIQIEDLTSGATHTGVTRSNSYMLPMELVPGDGQPHQIRWRVSVGAPNAQGALRIVSGEGGWRTFTWQSR
jgi:hypothetical protein